MNEFFTSGIESMAQTEGGTVIVCHCDSDPDSPNQCCATNNYGATCAQSEPGKNISCSEFNENCNGHDHGNDDEEDEDYNTDDPFGGDDDPFGDDDDPIDNDPQWQYC